MKTEILLIPEKTDAERASIAQIWQANGGEVLRIGKFWIAPETSNKRVCIYGNDTFALVLAQVLNLRLISPKDEVITQMDFEFVKRKIEIITLENIDKIQFPKFIKPVKPKLFAAKIFDSIHDLKIVLSDLENENLICSEIVKIEKEVRAFILNQKIMDLAYYEGDGSIEEPRMFIENLLKNSILDLPITFVLDLGWTAKEGWLVIEVNSSWGAGLNYCKPQNVITCIRAATQMQYKTDE